MNTSSRGLFVLVLAFLTSCGAVTLEKETLPKSGQASRGTSGGSAPSKTLTCQIADASNRGPMAVPPTVQRGETALIPAYVSYRGHRASVLHQIGDSTESLANLTLRVDDSVAHVFNAGSIDNAQLLGRDYFLQCAFE